MMILYSKPACPLSQQCRFMLYEKNIDFEIRDIDHEHFPQALSWLAPNDLAPVLVDRGVTLCEPKVINEYIDERYPHPQLIPVDPAERACVRLFLLNFEREFFVHFAVLEKRETKKNAALQDLARTHLRARLISLVPLLRMNMYILGNQFSILDVALAPLLWRLEHYDIKMTKNEAPLLKYAERIFTRPAYIDAMTSFERVMRK